MQRVLHGASRRHINYTKHVKLAHGQRVMMAGEEEDDEEEEEDNNDEV